MLNEFEIDQVWEGMLSAEARSLYFASLASRYTRQKQLITGLSFFLSSGVVVGLLAKLPNVITLMAALLVALLNAYSVAVGLEKKIGTMVKLHSRWQEIATGYSDLWSRTYEEDAKNKLAQIVKMERDPSELAAVEAPNDEALMGKWQDRVFASYHLG